MDAREAGGPTTIAVTWLGAVAVAAGWLAVLVLQVARLRRPREVPTQEEGGPFVSFIVPARNEAANIERCVGSIVQSRWDEFEVIVVDDQSDDGTGAIARSLDRGRAKDLRVIDGRPLPEGWVGKPWACWQGAEVARGEWLLFTDADTWHSPEALGRTAAAIAEDGADVLSVTGYQEVASFWERLVQPHVFFLMVQAFPPLHRPVPRRKWRRAVATGQYLLFKRKAYDGIGGHEAVKDAVVEDLRLAQLSTRAGYAVAIRDGGTGLKTRMYRSLGAILEGWSKNMSIGAKQTYGPVGGRLLLAGMLASHPLLWLAPAVVLVAAAAGFVGVPMLACAAIVYACSAVLWAAVSKQVAGGSALFGVIYPLGAAVLWIIVARSALRGSRITWKGRDFKASVPS